MTANIAEYHSTIPQSITQWRFSQLSVCVQTCLYPQRGNAGPLAKPIIYCG